MNKGTRCKSGKCKRVWEGDLIGSQEGDGNIGGNDGEEKSQSHQFPLSTVYSLHQPFTDSLSHSLIIILYLCHSLCHEFAIYSTTFYKRFRVDNFLQGSWLFALQSGMAL